MKAFTLAYNSMKHLLPYVIFDGNFDMFRLNIISIFHSLVANQNFKMMMSTGDVEFKADIKFCMGLDKAPSEMLKMLQNSSTTQKCSRALVFKWH